MKKEYLRRFIKLAVQPMFHPRVPFKVRRYSDEKVQYCCSVNNRGVTRSTVTLGEVSAYQAQVARKASEAQAKRSTGKAKHRCCILHGGWLCIGDVATHRQVVDGIALIANATVVDANLSLSPRTSLSRCARRRFWRLPSLA